MLSVLEFNIIDQNMFWNETYSFDDILQNYLNFID